MKTKIYFIGYWIITCLLAFSCQKSFLETRQNKALLVPTTLNDFASLLDNSSDVMNQDPGLSLIASDDFYATEVALVALNFLERNSYLWHSGYDFYEGYAPPDWQNLYRQIFYSNVVLDGLINITRTNKNKIEFDRIKGSALFHRSWAFYQLAQVFAEPYKPSTRNQDSGIILRLSANINDRPLRSTNDATYQQILKDLLEAEELLPITTSITSRPSRIAAQAFLARLYLTMQDNGAKQHATLALSMQDTLLDYESIIATPIRPMPQSVPNGNIEVIFHSTIIPNFSFPGNGLSNTLIRVDSTLYRSYDENDRRKALFYYPVANDQATFKGSYVGMAALQLYFTGLATDELYLILAECEAREKNITESMRYLNILLKTRWKKDKFITIIASTAEEALKIVLIERRKELVARGLRWSDLRRLNQNEETAVTLSRKLKDQTIQLKPNDNRYVFLLPENEVTENIPQNFR